jgi:hypothetical protein
MGHYDSCRVNDWRNENKRNFSNRQIQKKRREIKKHGCLGAYKDDWDDLHLFIDYIIDEKIDNFFVYNSRDGRVRYITIEKTEELGDIIYPRHPKSGKENWHKHPHLHPSVRRFHAKLRRPKA